MKYAGIGVEESYASTLPEEAGGVPTRWGEGCYVESLLRANERRERKKGGKVEFVAGSRSGGSSAAGTPKTSGVGRKGGVDVR